MIEHIYRFPTEGEPVSCFQIKSGHINRTYLIETDKGDKYFAISRPQQNLDRCRTQLKLAYDIEQKWELMQQICREEAARLGRRI